MAYFPFFIDIKDQRCLVVGGGNIALRRVRKLLEYDARVLVVSTGFCDELSELAAAAPDQRIVCTRASYNPEYLEGMFLVIAATDNREVNHRISMDCRKRGIPISSATGKENSTFAFPSLIRRGSLSIGISSGAVSPSVSKCMREAIEDIVPENIDEILLWLDDVRQKVLQEVPADRRGAAMKACYLAALHKGTGLTEQETDAVISSVGRQQS